MEKIASPQDLQAELRSLLAYCQGPTRPSRDLVASKLRDLADRVAAAGTELATGAKLKVLYRRGSWPPDMYTKGTLVEVVKGGKVGEKVTVKMKGDVMSRGQTYTLQANKDGTFFLVGDSFKRKLKVQVQ